MSATRSARGVEAEREPAEPGEPRRARTKPGVAVVPSKASIDRIVETAIYLQTESRRLAREQCARHGITATQLNVLKLLQNVGDLSLSELSRRMTTTNSTVTGIVDRMVAARLVAREQSAEDRRVWMIKLAPEGRALARKIDVAPWDILRSAVMALPPAELGQLIVTLTKVAEHVERITLERDKETR